MRYIFIINPIAGEKNDTDEITAQISACSKADQCEFHLTTGIGDATEYVKKWCRENPGEDARFVACGGDGTINEVVNGVMQSKEYTSGHLSMSAYPCGSGNDFVKVFGGAEVFQSVEKIVNAEDVGIDLLKTGDRYCVNIIHFGFDSDVLRTVDELKKKTGHGGAGHYISGVMHAVIHAMKNHFTVTADGEVLNPDGIALLCSVANGQYVGGAFKCSPRADVTDGLIDIVMIKPVSRAFFMRYVTVFAKGKHLDDPNLSKHIVYRRVKKVVVDSPDRDFAFSLDGEITPIRHFEVEILPKCLNFAVPK